MVARNLAVAPSSSTACTVLEGCAAHRPPYLISFLLAAAVVLGLALFCCAWLAIIKMIARAALGGTPAAASAARQLPVSNPGASSLVGPSLQLQPLQGATLVLFPGEAAAHTLAVPAKVMSPPVEHTAPNSRLGSKVDEV
ncbi:hypothetical protein GOP47_0003202 [Adiantum capillus-veneris]|uniref:Uncharacterized protein n=1 Tax=Adiantum capillus-veneris TaxID=13818 RepID=A0A9D4VBS3_ADICA|nr:hypothetical protein GOP47_0003202 [Adiantum capillus-veneris]